MRVPYGTFFSVSGARPINHPSNDSPLEPHLLSLLLLLLLLLLSLLLLFIIIIAIITNIIPTGFLLSFSLFRPESFFKSLFV